MKIETEIGTERERGSRGEKIKLKPKTEALQAKIEEVTGREKRTV